MDSCAGIVGLASCQLTDIGHANEMNFRRSPTGRSCGLPFSLSRPFLERQELVRKDRKVVFGLADSLSRLTIHSLAHILSSLPLFLLSLSV